MALQVRCKGDEVVEIPEDVLVHFGTLVDMRKDLDLDGAGAAEDSTTGHVVDIGNVSHTALGLAIKFYTARTDVAVSDDDAKFVAAECTEQTLLTDLLCAANYLDAQVLLNASIMVIANVLKDKTSEEIMAYFNVTGAFTHEEETAALGAHPWLSPV